MVSKRNAILAIVLAGAVVTSGLVLLVNTPTQQPYDVTVTDALGRNVTLTGSPARIVSCAPEITELLCAVGAGDRLVAVTDYCDYPSEIVSRKENGTLRSIGNYWDPQIEVIINQTPDLVMLVESDANHVALASNLEAMGFKAIVTYAGTTLDEVYLNVLLVGKALKMDEKADSLVADMGSTIELVKQRLNSTQPRERVLFVLWFDDPIYVAGSGTFISEVIWSAGGVNAISASGWVTISKEDVFASAPDVIFVSGTMSLLDSDDILSTMETDPIWSMTDAVKDGRVYVLMYQGESIFLRKSVRIVEAVELMAEVLQPAQFNVVVPHVIGDDYRSYLVPLVPVNDERVATVTYVPVGA